MPMQQKKSELHQHIDSCVLRFQGGNDLALDQVYQQLFTYSLRIISKTCSKIVNADDVEASIIPSTIFALAEEYDGEQGSFLLYLGQTIRIQTMEGIRFMDNRRGAAANPNSSWGEPSSSSDEVFLENIIDDLERKKEIEFLAKVLGEFEIQFEDLGRICPRQPKTKLQAQKAAMMLSQDEYLCDFMFSRKILPSKILEEAYKFNRTLLDKYWKYIVMVAVIIIHDLKYLKPKFLTSQEVIYCPASKESYWKTEMAGQSY